MRRFKIQALIVGSLVASACDNAYDPDAPAIDPTAPRIHITSPERGTFAGAVDSIEVRGTVFDDVRPGAGQADVGRLDAEAIDEVEDLELLLDRGRGDAGRLQAVAQGLVVELDHAGGAGEGGARGVPVVDQVVVGRAHFVSGAGGDRGRKGRWDWTFCPKGGA
jgi:hypothetical protein